MSKSSTLSMRDLRDIYRLVGDCRDLGADPVLWQGRLLEGVLGLVGATAASGGEGRWQRPRGSATPASAFSVGFDASTRDRYRTYLRTNGVAGDPTMKALGNIPGPLVVRTRDELIPDRDWYHSRLFNEYLKPSHFEHLLYSVSATAEHDAVFVVGLYRGPGERNFSDRERDLLRVLHREVRRLIGTSLASVFDAGPLQLPRRERETLTWLLEGDSEKQVAIRLGVSPATAHQYVTSLYRRFGVRSRAELLAYFLRRQRALLRSQSARDAGIPAAHLGEDTFSGGEKPETCGRWAH